MPTVGSIYESTICVPESERSNVPGLVPGSNNVKSMCGVRLVANRWLALWFVLRHHPPMLCIVLDCAICRLRRVMPEWNMPYWQHP